MPVAGLIGEPGLGFVKLPQGITTKDNKIKKYYLYGV